jgi:type I restriction-modification system DNA methylase subunit
MALFQKSVLNKYLKGLDESFINQQYEVFKKYFLHPEIQDNIRSSKEEQFQATFLNELFVKVLGYTLNPNQNYNLTTEFKNVKNAKKADGAILQNGKAVGVIELKGMNTTSLDKVEGQAFGYKNNQPDAVYVITSNFEKLRFYIDDAVSFEEFNLFHLSLERFKILYLCLAKDNIFIGLPKQMKDTSLAEEENITKKLYKDYSTFKNDLFNSIVKLNPQFDKLLLFKKTQKLLDRFLFIFFSEDGGLLPPNSIKAIVDQWVQLRDELDEYTPLYNRFKKYFGYMDTGYKGKKHDIFAYNGGLFAADEILDTIKIDDTLLYTHTQKLSRYDFKSEVDVNILGHIFEHSLNEIEEVTAELAGQTIDKSKTKRKKDGVFYTPKYITKYIVENTVGKLCEDKKTELNIDEAEYNKDRKGRNKATLKKLKTQLETYRNWLLGITICDPACGSGAFLNQTLEFLIEEHTYIDELETKLLGGSFVFPNIENAILENNLHGVDINEESVDIAKLSLWLRSAKPNRKLNSLNSNIKCGNSLIDDKEVAGDKAFDWKLEFPKVFEKGGFDVVIGNPPYVGEKGNSIVFNNLKKIPKWKKYYRRRSNLYYFFVKLGFDLLKKDGIQSLIIPREFTNADWADKVRKEIIKNSKIISIVDFNDVKVFGDVGTTSLIITHAPQHTNDIEYWFKLKLINNNSKLESILFDKSNYESIKSNFLGEDGSKLWNFYQEDVNLNGDIIGLGSLYNISQGVVTGADKVTKKHIIKGLIKQEFINRGIFILNKELDYRREGEIVHLNINDKWVKLQFEDISFLKPFIKTGNLRKWFVGESDLLLIYIGTKKLTENIESYLKQFSGVLLNRSTIINENEKINLDEFNSFTKDDIKKNYSSAGAVQKIMQKKKWYLPLYERENIPFDSEKIIINTRNMDKFTFSANAAYSSGGGGGGQNFIYPNLEIPYWKEIIRYSTIKDFVLFTNAILNSSKVQKYIKSANFSQLSTSKIGDLPIIKINFEDGVAKEIYKNIIESINEILNIIETYKKLNYNFIRYVITEFSNIDYSNLMNWYSMSFNEFIEIMEQNNNEVISKSEKFEWSIFFSDKQKEIIDVKQEIISYEENINKMIDKF